MADITRWDPWGGMLSLRQAMDRLLEDSFVRSGGQGGWSGSEGPNLEIDCYEKDDELVVTTALPGIKPEDVDVSIQGDVLTIRGESRDEQEEKGEQGRWLRRERRFGSYFRQIQLPVRVNAEQAKARFEDGVLRLELPKAEEARERKIRIGAGAEGQGREIPTETKAGNGSKRLETSAKR